MAAVAAKKKSIITDSPIVANNTLLNQSASQSTSLYQQCSSLRARLMRIINFSPYFSLASPSDARHSTDPVTQLWDLFSLGISLCFIYNNLPASYTKIDIDTSTEGFDISNDRTKKRAIALFSMQMGKEFGKCEPFTVTDLWNRNSTDGLVKVINGVTSVVQRLPAEAFAEPLPSSPSQTSLDSALTLVNNGDSTPIVPPTGQAVARRNIIREIVETERKYVQDLEIMQKYSNALSRSNTVDQDTIHLLFPNLNNLVNFQRKFLIKLEGTAEMPWPEQRWGSHFIECEEQFIVYEPYCANYTKATELMLENEQNLMDLSHMISVTAVRGELPAFLIKPIQRVCKYPLLLESLIKACNPAEYNHYEELQAGHLAAKRIADKINEAQRRSENDVTVQSLHTRIEDWKGHHLSNFGDLLLDDIFVVTKSEVDREYHVFLFEKIILCCKEAPVASANGAGTRKVNKSNSILKKQSSPPQPTLPGGVGQPHKKTTPLLLKGRIFLNNVTKAVPAQAMSTPAGVPPQHPLAVWWRGDDDLEYFTLRCRTQDTMKQWEAHINRLIKEAASRRASERGTTRIMANYTNSTNPAPQGRQSATASYYDKQSPQSVYMASLPSHPSNGRGQRLSPFSSDEQVAQITPNGMYTPGGPHGYPPHNGFEEEFEQDDVYEDYPPAVSYPSSGRGTPVGSRSRGNAYSMPPERDAVPGYDRPRAQTEHTNGPVMAQWRSTHGIPPPPTPSPNGVNGNGLPSPVGRPAPPRLLSTMSTASYSSDASFGNGVRTRPALRSQFSTTKLKSAYDTSEFRGQLPPPPLTNGAPIMNRSRSASQPSAYVPKSATAPPPPLPTSSHWTSQRSATSMGENKRGSGSSQSTADSSDYSPTSNSPITPYGSSESSLGAVRKENTVKVKVHYYEDIFVIQVPRSTDYAELVGKVGRKIRLCGPDRHDGPLRVKYCDEDGDLVSLGSTEDVQMAFEQFRPGGQVVLYVT